MLFAGRYSPYISRLLSGAINKVATHFSECVVVFGLQNLIFATKVVLFGK
jgi:hypothetical protein